MGLTETQKNFKKQMKEINKNTSPYENARSGNPFHRTSLTIGSTVLVIVVFFIAAYLMHGPNGHANYTIDSINSVRPTASVQERSIPKEQEELSNAIQLIFQKSSELQQSVETVSKFHREKSSAKRKNEYRDALISAISSTDKILNDFNHITIPAAAEPLYNLLRDKIYNAKNEF